MMKSIINLKKQSIRVIWVLVIAGSLLGCTAQKAVKKKPEAKYHPVALNYVDLSDNATVSAQPVQTRPLTNERLAGANAAVVVKLDSIIHPNLSGIGGAFNEMGGDAFMSLPASEKKLLAEALFNPKNGSGLSLCRTAVGSSDFGLSAYSYSEIQDDYEMKHFSIVRDEATVLPLIQAAQAENQALRIFASPWSPPGWMKESGKMDGGKKDGKKNTLKADPSIYKTYALYFAKYVQAYAAHGVNIERLIIQNEPDMNPTYPGCDMLPDQMAELTFNYIRPAMTQAGLKTELWAGSFRRMRKDAQTFMAIKGAEAIDGVGLQYCDTATMETLQADHPGLKMMHTEGKCENGNNSMEQARKRLGEVSMWLNGGCENYCYWNMILNETSESAWGWKQNSLIKIDRQAGTVTYNADYAPISLLSRFIRPGDQSLKVTVPKGITAIAVRNDKHLVVFLQNDANAAAMQNIDLSGREYTVELPAQSLCAVVFNEGID